MENHIKKLIEATKNITVRYSAAYNEDGPDIGIRGAFETQKIQSNGTCYTDSVIIDGISWLIAGDIIVTKTGKRYRDIYGLIYREIDPRSIQVILRAQASVCGKIVQVTLGKKSIYSISYGSMDGMMELIDLD